MVDQEIFWDRPYVIDEMGKIVGIKQNRKSVIVFENEQIADFQAHPEAHENIRRQVLLGKAIENRNCQRKFAWPVITYLYIDFKPPQVTSWVATTGSPANQFTMLKSSWISSSSSSSG